MVVGEATGRAQTHSGGRPNGSTSRRADVLVAAGAVLVALTRFS